MEDYNVNVDHAKHSIGGDFGHVIRRITHVSMVIIPLLYYSYGNKISAFLSLNPQEFVSLVCLSIMLVEGMRLKMGIVVIGQREYESDQFSALAWGTLSVSIALLISPTMGNTGFKAGLFGTPIIFGLCIVDPVMGEVKRRTEGLGTAIVFGLLVSLTLLVAMITNLVILPTLLLTLERRLTTKSFEEPYFDAYVEESNINWDDLNLPSNEMKQNNT